MLSGFCAAQTLDNHFKYVYSIKSLEKLCADFNLNYTKIKKVSDENSSFHQIFWSKNKKFCTLLVSPNKQNSKRSCLVLCDLENDKYSVFYSNWGKEVLSINEIGAVSNSGEHVVLSRGVTKQGLEKGEFKVNHQWVVVRLSDFKVVAKGLDGSLPQSGSSKTQNQKK